MDSLGLLTDEDLASIGMKLGPRKALLKALADTEKVRRLSHPRDISHQDVKRSMSKQFRTGNEISLRKTSTFNNRFIFKIR